MRVVIKLANESREMVEVWRKGKLFTVVPFNFFVDEQLDPANQLIRKLAEGKTVHMELTYHSEHAPGKLDGPI